MRTASCRANMRLNACYRFRSDYPIFPSGLARLAGHGEGVALIV